MKNVETVKWQDNKNVMTNFQKVKEVMTAVSCQQKWQGKLFDNKNVNFFKKWKFCHCHDKATLKSWLVEKWQWQLLSVTVYSLNKGTSLTS